MSHSKRTTVNLKEFHPRRLSQAELPCSVAEKLWQEYGDQPKRVAVEFPSVKTDYHWEITSLGWVGYIPLTPEFGFKLNSKVPLSNIFGMLEYAYRLRSFYFLDGVVENDSLESFFEHLANILALRVMERARKGFYRSYLHRSEVLSCLRGRMNTQRAICRPWDVNLQCHFEEHTADIVENQILAWTLMLILRSGICTERVTPNIRRAYRSLQGTVTPHSFDPRHCVGRLYNRLNEDYRPLHALCRFFLEQTGPTHRAGNHQMMPFLVNMARLFELFVYEWLREHLPPQWVVRAQEQVTFGDDHLLQFDIDLVLYDTVADTVRCILDTKYKVPTPTPAKSDVAQVIAYAEAKGCREAILVYPAPISKPLDHTVGNIRVRSLHFCLGAHLESAGEEFLAAILPP